MDCSRPGRWNNWPLSLIGMLVIVVAGERYVARHRWEFSTIWASSWHRTGSVAVREAARCDVLAFGDSLVKHGVLPHVLEQRLGLRAYNLAEFNGEAPTSYFLFRKALAAGARPMAVFLDGELLEDNPLARTRLWPELIDMRETIELAAKARDADFFASVALARALPSVKDRYEIRAEVLAALGGEFGPSKFVIFPHLRNWAENRGAHVVPSRSVTQESDNIRRLLIETNYLPATWTPNYLNAYYISQFVKLAAERQIPVYWLWPPVHPEVQARRARGGRDAVYAQFVRRLADKFPNLVVIDGRDAGYVASAMYDATHLNKTGACAYTESLAEILAKGPYKGVAIEERWIPLPHFQDRAVTTPVEDLEESILAMRQGRNRGKG
jgi:hypothetical protein